MTEMLTRQHEIRFARSVPLYEPIYSYTGMHQKKRPPEEPQRSSFTEFNARTMPVWRARDGTKFMEAPGKAVSTIR